MEMARQANSAFDVEAQGYDRMGARRSQRGTMPDSVRLGFVRKVYGILATQVLFTVLTVVACMFWSPLHYGIISFATRNGRLLQFFLTVPPFVMLLMMHCLKHSYPMNFACLSIFTAFIAADVGLVCAVFAEAGLSMVVLQACLLTLLIFGGLTIYTMASKRDFSYLGGFLFSGLLCLVGYGFLAMLFPSLNTGMAGMITSWFGAVLFSAYIVFDTWRLEKVHGVDDYIVAAIELYLDIVNLFLQLLKILAALSKKN